VPAEPNPGCPTQGQADGKEPCRQPQGPPCPRRREARPSLGEDAAWAGRMAAEHSANAELPCDPVATPWEIGERPGVMAMDTPCRDIAPRAAGCCLCGRDQEGDLRVCVVDVPGVQLEQCRVGPCMRKRFANLHVSYGVNFSSSSSISYTPGMGRGTASPKRAKSLKLSTSVETIHGYTLGSVVMSGGSRSDGAIRKNRRQESCGFRNRLTERMSPFETESE
jgi:hypothetical protein